jgi:hypothetical protein
MNRIVAMLVVLALAAGFYAMPALSGESKDADKDKDKEAAKKDGGEKAEDVLAKSDEDLKDGFNRGKDWAEKFMYAYACVKKNVKHKDAKDFYVQAFELEFDDYKQDVGTRLPYEPKEDKEYAVEKFEDVLKDVKACYLIIQTIKKKRKDITTLKAEIKRILDRQGEIVNAAKQGGTTANQSQLDSMEKERRNKEQMVKRIEGEIQQAQTRFISVGLARLKKGAKSKEKITSSFAKDAQKILEKIIQST